MFNWHDIWEKKGRIHTRDLTILDGFENNSDVNPKKIALEIINQLNINKEDKVLEVGCGAGMIAQFLKCDYVGIDYSKGLVEKHIEILNNSVLHCHANDLPFKDKIFDKCFAYSIFQYFNNKKYARKVISEMKRVSKKMIFIGDLPTKSHDKEHLLFKKNEFSNYSISDGFYNSDRFNIWSSFD